MFREITIGLALSVSVAWAGNGASLIGRAAPELMIEKWDLPEGQTPPRLHDLKGKVVAILLFQSTCGSCHRSGFPLFQEIEKQLGSDPDLATLYIQTPFEMLMLNQFSHGQASVKLYGVKGKFGQDRALSGSVVPASFQRMRADGTPWVVFVDRTGIVRFAGYPEAHRGMLDTLRGLLAAKEPASK